MYSASSKLEEAAELYQKAGNIYKANKHSTGESGYSRTCMYVCVCSVCSLTLLSGV